MHSDSASGWTQGCWVYVVGYSNLPTCTTCVYVNGFPGNYDKSVFFLILLHLLTGLLMAKGLRLTLVRVACLVSW